MTDPALRPLTVTPQTDEIEFLTRLAFDPLPSRLSGPVTRSCQADALMEAARAEVTAILGRIATFGEQRRLSGSDLRLLRVSQRVTATAVAEKAGWARQRVTTLEAQLRPTTKATERYMSALGRCTGTDPTI